MKKFTSLFTSLFLAACSTAPVIVPDTTSNNVVMKKLNYQIDHADRVSGNWGWILWYLPLVAAGMIWMWRKYIKECPECGKSEEEKPKALNG
jgi:hypothetical protein